MANFKKACERCEVAEFPKWGIVCPKCKTPLRRYIKSNGEAVWDDSTKIIKTNGVLK